MGGRLSLKINLLISVDSDISLRPVFWAGRIELYYLHLNVRLSLNLITAEYVMAKSALLPSECIQTKTSNMSLVSSSKTGCC